MSETSKKSTLSKLIDAAQDPRNNLKYEVVESKDVPGEWQAEAIGPDGEIFIALFSGSNARDFAEEYAEREQLFNLRWDSDMRAIKRWQDKTGKTLTWPDHADLCVWLMERIEKYESLEIAVRKRFEALDNEDESEDSRISILAADIGLAICLGALDGRTPKTICVTEDYLDDLKRKAGMTNG